MKNFNKEVKVGVFAAISIVLLYFGFQFLKGSDFFSTTNKYYLVFDNVDQLAVSNPVLINGYAVGRVSGIRIMQNRQNKVLVEIDIDSKIVLGDTTKAILNSDFLGGKSILLSIGSTAQPAQPGDTLRAEIAKGIMDVFTETAEPVADNLSTTLRKFNSLLDNLIKESQRIDDLFVKLETTPGLLNATLATAQTEIKQLSGSVKTTSENLNNTLAELKPTLQNFRELSDSLKRIKLGEAMNKTNQSLAKLNETLTRLNSGNNTMSKLMTEDTLYVNLNKLLLTLDTLAYHLDNNPKHFFAPLGKSKRKIERDRRKEEEEKRKQ
ncbi:MAG: MlaD family protein [Cyclobacteriaceae bacterium]|nr:MlaD family protein [Cyclobacteriaceae bacterium]